MREQLINLIEAKAESDVKLLHDELRKIRDQYQQNGTFISSMHVQSAVRACSDYVERLALDALSDYKRAASLDKKRFKKDYLESLLTDFLSLLAIEFKKIDDILHQATNGIAAALSNNVLASTVAYTDAKNVTLKRVRAEIELFNAEILSAAPSLGVKVRKFFRDNIIGVILGAIVGAGFLALRFL